MERKTQSPTLIDSVIETWATRRWPPNSTDWTRRCRGTSRRGLTTTLFADSACMDAKRQAALERRGVFCGIIQRRVRGQAELTQEQKAHNQWCARFRAFVERPFIWMKKSGSLRRARHRGLARNALDFVLTAITCNFRRTFSLWA